MKIYIDLVILLNYFIDFLLLYGTSKLLKDNISIKKILLGSLVASSSIFISFIKINNLLFILSKIIISLLIIYITFGKNNYFRHLGYFYLLSIILGGGLGLIDNTYKYHNGLLFINKGYSLNIILSIIVIPIIILEFVRENLNYKNTYSNIYLIDIYINKNKYHLKGILDTGNRLIDPYKRRNIIVVNSNININGNKYILVPFNTINSSGLLKCFSPSKIVINNKEFNNCLIGINDNLFDLKDIDCILPNKFKEEL